MMGMKLKFIICLVFCLGVVFKLHAQILPAAFGVAAPSRPVANTIVTSGLVLHLDAGNTASYPGSGSTWTDLSGSSNHGTLINSPTFNNTNEGNLVFNGTNQYITLPGSSNYSYGTGDFSIDYWFKFNSLSSSSQSFLDAYSSPQNSSSGGIFGFNVSNSQITTYANNGQVFTSTAITLPINTWINLTFVRSNGVLYVYKNSNLIDSSPCTWNFQFTGNSVLPNLYIGINPGANYLANNGYFFTGSLGNIKFYKGLGLTSTQVLQNYNALRPRFGDVTNPTTGKIWMDRNLGAIQVAASSTDANSYGDLYQWGRGADGHQIRTSATTSTLSSTDVPGNANFVLAGSPYDWRSTANNNLWQGVNGTNNPCPSGYRLPTETEWVAERLSWSSQNAAGAFSSPLKLPAAGIRRFNDGGFDLVNTGGRYWSSTVSSPYSRYFYFDSNADMFTDARAYGASVRCIKE